MITNFELIEAIDPRRAALGLGALGGSLYGAHILSDIGDGIAGLHNVAAQGSPKGREQLFNDIQQNLPLTGKTILSGEMVDRLDSKQKEMSYKHALELANARSAGSTIGGLTGLGLGGLAGAGLTRLVIGKDPNKTKKIMND